jgi:hypothetical protein
MVNVDHLLLTNRQRHPGLCPLCQDCKIDLAELVVRFVRHAWIIPSALDHLVNKHSCLPNEWFLHDLVHGTLLEVTYWPSHIPERYGPTQLCTMSAPPPAGNIPDWVAAKLYHVLHCPRGVLLPLIERLR